MITLSAKNQHLINRDHKTFKWRYLLYESDDTEHDSDADEILVTSFSGIDLKRSRSDGRITAPSEVKITVSDSGNTLNPADFEDGGYLIIELYLYDGAAYEKIAGWKFRIRSAIHQYQALEVVGEDYLQQFLRGTYPNTRKPEDIFPSNRSYNNDKLCIPVTFGTAYIPLRDVFISDAGYILLGDTTPTYTITKVRSPRQSGGVSVWDSGTYTFTQSTKADVDSNNWRVFQATIADADGDGTVDSHGFWGTAGGPILDPLIKFTRSDTVSKTSPADIIEYVLEDMGVPSAMLDSTTFTAAKTTFTAWGLAFNGGYWFHQPREAVLSQLLTMCNSCLKVTEKIELHVLSKTSIKTITSSDVLKSGNRGGQGSFKYRSVINKKLSDSGYVNWQQDDQPQDAFIKTLVGADGSTTDYISDEILNVPFIQDSIEAQKIGILYYQRKLCKIGDASFNGKAHLLTIQPDDAITIDDTNYGYSSYDAIVDRIKIGHDLSTRISASKYSLSLNDWNDLSPKAHKVATDNLSGSWQNALVGPETDSTNTVLENVVGEQVVDDDSPNSGQSTFVIIKNRRFYDSSLPEDQTWHGDFVTEQIGEAVHFKDLLYWDISEGKWKLADFDTIATVGRLGLALKAAVTNATIDILTKGYIRYDRWSWTTNDTKKWLYGSTTPGEITETAVSADGDYSIIVGTIRSATTIWFDPGISYGKWVTGP